LTAGEAGAAQAVLVAWPESAELEEPLGLFLTMVRGVEIIGLDHVQVAAPVGSESEARRFYGGLLGLSELEKPEALRARGGVWFACGAHQLHVGVTQDFSPATKAHPALRVHLADLDLIAERLSAAGATVQWDEAIPDTRRFYTADPWRNRIELIGVQAALSADGA
jgi:catechol-2,3-dioxygenase